MSEPEVFEWFAWVYLVWLPLGLAAFALIRLVVSLWRDLFPHDR